MEELVVEVLEQPLPGFRVCLSQNLLHLALQGQVALVAARRLLVPAVQQLLVCSLESGFRGVQQVAESDVLLQVARILAGLEELLPFA
jgi:hypothetical protein